MRTLDEANTLSGSDVSLLSALKSGIAAVLAGCDVWLYGSAARGAQTAESDYDLLVLTDEPVSTSVQARVRDVTYAIELEKGIVFSTVFRTRTVWDSPLMKESPFHEEVTKDAIAL